MSKETRLEQLSKKRSERNIALILSGIIIIVIIFFFYGVPLLINFSLFIVNLKGGNDSPGNSSDNALFIAPPILDPLPDATNSATINISGNASLKQTIKLYINDKNLEQTQVTDKKNFSFVGVTLKQGDNDIKVKSVDSNNKESNYSQDIHVVYKNKAPSLQLNHPEDKQTFSGNSQIKIEGISDPGVRVTINDYWAIVDNKGNFSYLLNLQKGENKIKIISLDDAGNQTVKEITITLNQ